MINVAIVEDEQEAVEYLSDCLHRYGEKTGETFSFTHFPEPITFLEKYKPVYDLVFMEDKLAANSTKQDETAQNSTF